LIDMGDEGLLTSRDLSRRLGISPRTVARWVREGRLTPEYTTPGGQYRFRWDDVRKQLGLRPRPD
jgi:excisionase family DNA binding protein